MPSAHGRPRLQLAGQGVAMQNAREELKEVAQQHKPLHACDQKPAGLWGAQVASRVSEWTNDDDGVARRYKAAARSRTVFGLCASASVTGNSSSSWPRLPSEIATSAREHRPKKACKRDLL